MPRFAANLTFMFAELPYIERFAAAAEAGFTAVEVLFPYDAAASETRRALLANGLKLVLINAPPPNYTGGTPGFAAVPELADRFHHDLRRTLRYADALGAGIVHVMAGNATGAVARETFVSNLIHAADSAPNQQFTIAPLNPVDWPGTFLNDFDQARAILADVNRPNVGLQFDTYHAQMIAGAALDVWQRIASDVVHIQIADTPDRAPPMTGKIDWPALLSAIDHSGYSGWVSGAYHSGKDTRKTLGWVSQG